MSSSLNTLFLTLVMKISQNYATLYKKLHNIGSKDFIRYRRLTFRYINRAFLIKNYRKSKCNESCPKSVDRQILSNGILDS